MIRMLVGRCHVSSTNRNVIKYVISRLKKGYRTFSSLPKEERKKLMREVIKAHEGNKELYNYIMTGP